MKINKWKINKVKISENRKDQKTLVLVFQPLVTNFVYGRGHCELGCVPITFWGFTEVSTFPK